MDLGATVCVRTRPRCDACPVRCGLRRAHRRIASRQLPSPRPRKALPQRAVRVLLIERGGEILFEKRPPLGIWGGLWSLPECALDDDARAVVRTRFGADVDVARCTAADRARLHALRVDAASAARRRGALAAIARSAGHAVARAAGRAARRRCRRRSGSWCVRLLGLPVPEVRRQAPLGIGHQLRGIRAARAAHSRGIALVAQLADARDPRVGVACLRARHRRWARRRSSPSCPSARRRTLALRALRAFAHAERATALAQARCGSGGAGGRGARAGARRASVLARVRARLLGMRARAATAARRRALARTHRRPCARGSLCAARFSFAPLAFCRASVAAGKGCGSGARRRRRLSVRRPRALDRRGAASAVAARRQGARCASCFFFCRFGDVRCGCADLAARALSSRHRRCAPARRRGRLACGAARRRRARHAFVGRDELCSGVVSCRMPIATTPIVAAAASGIHQRCGRVASALRPLRAARCRRRDARPRESRGRAPAAAPRANARATRVRARDRVRDRPVMTTPRATVPTHCAASPPRNAAGSSRSPSPRP